MATFEKGILGGFSGKVGNIVGSRWRGKNVMRSLPQRGNYTATEEQLLQRERFKTVVAFLNPIKSVLSAYFGKKQGDKSRYNLATSYHLTEALTALPLGEFVINYFKVLISKGDLRGLDNPILATAANQVLNISWVDNSGQGNATATDTLLVVVFSADLNLFQVYDAIATRDLGVAQITLPGYLAGLEVESWGSFVTANKKDAAISSYLGAVTVL
ncbi:DUF6266 family protein [Bizionia arctica]|uniref:Uncharacterized protein n=1 Tax=Bizionia arctica TaxID=1495645 RepID=A0A917GLE2_9FLAO|nr:DUF6266 family protein [Bizionia arctica]GGG50705.1 hypothetical protein GCM10010976_22390 [Bizionia arctica]